jgi:acetyl-CoA carboxylase carboxyltransferase component
LGGSDVHTRESGCVDNEAEDEADAFAQIRRFLSFLPSNVWEIPPITEPRPAPAGAEEGLRSIIPRNRKRSYSMKQLIALVVDGGDFFEISPNFGGSLITAFARVEGYAFGIVANNPMKYGGALDGDAADKQCRFLDLCDYFHVPVVYLVDIPGFMIGTHAERQGTLRRGMRAIWTWNGMAGAATSNAAKLGYRVAWPSGEFGSIPIEGGVDAAFRRQIESAPDPDAKREELESSLAKMRNPFLTAEALGVEEIIDPGLTRGYVSRFLKLAYRVLPQELGQKSRRGVRP